MGDSIKVDMDALMLKLIITYWKLFSRQDGSSKDSNRESLEAQLSIFRIHLISLVHLETTLFSL